ncbi:MAG: hypothetical protein HS118_04695 [Bacteroidia bacterium]|nr:hypothetical protein [Bacteroidia bacterium]HNT83194.1 hypothetical protein [Bacteroidia bacterium]
MEDDKSAGKELRKLLEKLFGVSSIPDDELNESDEANWDIKRDKMKLYIHEGIRAIPVYDDDRVFELTYKVAYVTLGCVRKDMDYVLYNQTIFKYLDKVYGMSWRLSVRADVLGLLPDDNN